MGTKWVEKLLAVLLAGSVLVVGMWVGAVRRANAQALAPYAEFQAMGPSDLATLQVKLTYVGVQNAVVPSVGFSSPVNSFDAALFAPFERPGISYANDSIAVRTFSATTAQLKAAIDNVGTLPQVTAGGVASNPFLSFALLNTEPIVKAFEAVVERGDAAKLFDELRRSLAGNGQGLRILADMACALDLLEPGRPTDVSNQTTVILKGLRLDRNSGRFVGTASITNDTGAPLPIPVSLVIDAEGNVQLFNSDGTTCGTEPMGRPFVNLSESPNAGEHVDVKLEFDNPDLEEINLTTKVLAGPGAR